MTPWHSVPLGKVVTFQRGYDLPHRVRKQGRVPIVSSAGVTDYHNVAMVDPPGVVTGRYGTIGEIFLIREPFWPLNTTLYVRDFHGNDPAFVFHLLHRFDFNSFSGKSGVPGVNRNDLHREPIALPRDVAEQRAIAAALSDVDALLGGLDQIIAKKRDLKRAAMRQLLAGHARLPGFHGEWEVKRLGELADIISGGTPRTNEPSYWNGGIKWCTPTDITRYAGKYLTETERTISRTGLNNSAAALLPVGALLLCSRATIGELKIAGTPICTNQGFKSLVCRPGVSNEYLYYKLLTMKQQMIERAFGSTFLEISTRNVSALEVAAPPLDEQASIAAVLSDMDAELSAIESRRDKTRALKQAMLQALLTGRMRLV